jgi:hypothetical protein
MRLWKGRSSTVVLAADSDDDPVTLHLGESAGLKRPDCPKLLLSFLLERDDETRLAGLGGVVEG